MPSHTLIHFLNAILLVRVLACGDGVAVLCLGGGHEHAPDESAHCESECSHKGSWPLPIPADEHEHDCGCTDVELTIAELLSPPRGDDGGTFHPAVAHDPEPEFVVAASGPGRRGPPMPPPWFDPGGAQRLVIVASVRLTI